MIGLKFYVFLMLLFFKDAVLSSCSHQSNLQRSALSEIPEEFVQEHFDAEEEEKQHKFATENKHSSSSDKHSSSQPQIAPVFPPFSQHPNYNPPQYPHGSTYYYKPGYQPPPPPPPPKSRSWHRFFPSKPQKRKHSSDTTIIYASSSDNSQSSCFPFLDQLSTMFQSACEKLKETFQAINPFSGDCGSPGSGSSEVTFDLGE